MFAVKFRIPVITVLLGITLFLGFGLEKINKENGIEALISTTNKDYLFFKSMEKEFGATDQIVLGISFQGSVYTKENLTLIRDFSSFLEDIDGIGDDDVLSLSTVENIDGIDGELIAGPIIPDKKKISETDAGAIKFKTRDNEMLKGKLVSSDEKSTVIIITVNTDISLNAEKVGTFIRRIESKTESIKTANPGIDIYRSGMVSEKYTVSEYMDRDMRVMFPIAIAVVMLVLLILSKSFSGVVIPLMVTLCSVVWTLGLKGWIGSPLTMAETIIPVMLIAIGCANGIHIVSEFLSFHRRGIKVKDAIERTMKDLKTPVILASLTTTLGFLSLVTAPGVSVRNMGIFLGFGVITAMIFSLFFVPAILSFTKENRIKAKNTKSSVDLTAIGNKIIKSRIPIIIASVLLLTVSVLGMINIKVETDQITFLKDSDPLKIATLKLQRKLGGVNTLDIIIEGDENTLKDQGTLKFMEKLQNYAEKLDSVSYTLSLVDYIKKINYEFHNKEKNFNRLPERTEIVDSEKIPGNAVISNLLFLYEMGGGNKLKKIVNDDYSIGKISIRLLDTSQIGIEKLVENLRTWIKENKPENITVNFSNDYMRLVMGGLVTKSQIRSFISTLATIILLLMIIFVSPLSGILTAIPVVIAVCFNFAVMWVTGTTLNVGTSIIASVGMGVGIDYAIHYFQRYKTIYLETGDNYYSIISALNKSAVPILSNATAVGTGFLTLMFSNYFMISSIGWITGLSMLTTALCALFVLPAYLAVFEPLKKRKN